MQQHSSEVKKDKMASLVSELAYNPSWTRTNEYKNQTLVPYRLAIGL